VWLAAKFLVRPRTTSATNRDREAPIALLYTTMNDFSERAAQSCLHQEYPSFRLFVLDDSTESVWQERVDAFGQANQEVTTIRRADRTGFKAGNLNHALQLINTTYEWFAVCDADGVLPADFLTQTMRHFADADIAFVQARQTSCRMGHRTAFASDLAASVDIYWEQVVPASAAFGFVMFHGHGGIIRTAVWREVGGFPSVVAEDLAFSTLARQKGYVGVIASDVVCEEEFPQSYEMFARRQLKYVRGTCEHLRHYMVGFLASRYVQWWEKVDRILATAVMLSALPLVVFLFAVVFVLPSSLGRIEEAGLRGLCVMAVVSVVAPLVPAIVHFWTRPKSLARYICRSATLQLSLIPEMAWDALVVAVTGRNFFVATGDSARNAKKLSARSMCNWRVPTVRLVGVCVFAAALVSSGSLALVPIVAASCCALASEGRLMWDAITVLVMTFVTFVVILLLWGNVNLAALTGLSLPPPVGVL
jgi:membrane glycosyltransferase